MNKRELPLVSIVIPAYNAEMFISRCINGVINQTYENLEIILSIDKSTDKTKEICSQFSYDKRLKLVCHDTRLGVSDNRNEGIKRANGKYVLFFDADDVPYQNCVEKTVKLAEENKLDWVKYGYSIVDNTLVERCRCYVRSWEETITPPPKMIR